MIAFLLFLNLFLLLCCLCACLPIKKLKSLETHDDDHEDDDDVWSNERVTTGRRNAVYIHLLLCMIYVAFGLHVHGNGNSLKFKDVNLLLHFTSKCTKELCCFVAFKLFQIILLIVIQNTKIIYI